MWRGLGTGERRRPRRRDAGDDRELGDDRRTVTAAASEPSGPLLNLHLRWTENHGLVSELLVKVEYRVSVFT